MTKEAQEEAEHWKAALTSMAETSERKRQWAADRGLFVVANIIEVYAKSLRKLIKEGPPRP